MLALVLALLAADREQAWAEDPPPPPVTGPLDSAYRITLETAVGGTPSGFAQLGAGIDLGWLPLRFVRLHALVGAAVLPGVGRFNRGSDAALRLLFGADGVLPLESFELFLGLESGFTYTSAHVVCFDCGIPFQSWTWMPSLRLRGGVELTATRPLLLGVSVAYGLFSGPLRVELHWVEVHGRIGFAF